ncbi:MAG: DUF3859 domain-containing protein [Nitrospirae bacterium]|nr:DUF3859 domain-containing protein [Nitrospirota bacterium]
MLIVLACCTMPFSALGAQIDGVDIVSYGIYVAGNAEKNAAEQGGQEKAWKLLEKSDRIPAKMATSFGIEYIIKGAPADEPVKITLRYLHPIISNPETGKKYTSQEVSIAALVGKKIHEGYTFDHEWELVTGAWVIQVFYDGRKLAEQYFTVYKP